jgi:CRP/FNR family cyclic AMP-dependent transcriptional regulator
MLDDLSAPAAAAHGRAQAALAHVRWPARARAIDARPHDATQGSERFAQLWAADHQSLALTPAELATLAGHLQFVTVGAGQAVIRQDEAGDFLVVVLDGRLAVEHVHPGGPPTRLTEARAGDMLGEMSLLDAGARFSACRTLTPCVLAVLDAQHLDNLMSAEPRIALALVTSLARRLSLRLRQVSARLSALLSGV